MTRITKDIERRINPPASRFRPAFLNAGLPLSRPSLRVLTPVFQQINQELSTLRQIKADQGQELLKDLIRDLRIDVLQPIAEQLDRSTDLTQEASNAVVALHAELGSVCQNLASSILTIEHFQQETLGRLEEFAHSLSGTLAQFQTETKIVLQEVAQEIKQGVEQSIVGLAAQRTAFAQSAEDAAHTFRGIREELSIALHERAEIEQQMLQEVQERIVEILTSADTTFQQQAHTLQAVGSEASGLMRQARTELHEGLQEVNGMLQNTHQTTQAELQQFRQNYQASLEEFFAQSATGMAAQRTAFTQSAEDAASTFRDIRGELQVALHSQAEIEKQMLQDVEARMTSILRDTHTAFQTPADSVKVLGGEASSLINSARENLVTSLQNVDGMLQNTRITMQEELEHFRQGYQASLQDFFSQQNNLLESTLGEQRQGLALVVENLETAFQTEAVRRQELAQQIEQSMSHIQETVEDVSNLANATGLNSAARLAQLQELSHGMGRQLLELRSAYQNLADQFNQSLQQGNEHLVGYLSKAAESEKQFFVQADKATANLCNNLLQAASYLVAAEDNRKQERGDS